jgi:hypothetical protein
MTNPEKLHTIEHSFNKMFINGHSVCVCVCVCVCARARAREREGGGGQKCFSARGYFRMYTIQFQNK